MIVAGHEIELPVVKKIVDYCDTRLEELRKLNDADQDAVKTASLRGQISEIKKLRKGLTLARPLKTAAENRNPYA